jgi:hypothetical protein
MAEDALQVTVALFLLVCFAGILTSSRRGKAQGAGLSGGEAAL